MKYIILFTLIYFFYKRYIALPPGGQNKNYPNDKPQDSPPKSGEYIDYEDLSDKSK